MARDLMEAVKKCRGSFGNFTGRLWMVSGQDLSEWPLFARCHNLSVRGRVACQQ